MLRFINTPDNTTKRNVNKTNENHQSSVEAKEEIEDDDEYEFVVEEKEAEDENHEVEVYLEEEDPFEADPIPDKITNLSSDDDYDVMFLKSLAPYFKQLDPIRKLVVRNKMQDMLLNEIAAQTSASHFNSKKS